MPRGGPQPAAWPAALVLGSIVSVQLGAGLADKLFGELPPAAVTGLRLWSAATVLTLLGARGAAGPVAALLRRRAWRDAATAAAFGVTLAVMNFSIYQAFSRIPLGVAVTIEFLGPLAVAVAGSRRLLDLLWVALAGTGVVFLTGGGTARLDLTGVAFAGVAGAGWAAYILLSSATGRRFPGSSGLVIAMVVAAVAVTPPAALSATSALERPAVLATGVAVGLLSSVVPYSLELAALRRLPPRVFGIWMSMEPAVAALIGLAMLGQALPVSEWCAIGCVVAASAGAARGRGAHPGTAPGALGRHLNGAHGPGGERGGEHSSYDGDVSADRVPAGSVSGALPGSPLKRALSRITDPVLAPGPVAMRNIALAAVVANAVIMMTGAAVQLSKSGLGCPDWPKCTAASLTAAHVPHQTMFNTWMEFGNRLITFPVVIVGVLALLLAWRFRPGGRRRRDLVWLAAALPAGAVGQAVIGGVVILTKLNPAWVAVHFMLSISIVAAAVTLHVRCREGTSRPRSLVRTDLRLLSGALVAVTAVMLAAGTVVNGAGPLVGNAAAPRFHFHLASFATTTFAGMTQLHADIGWLMGGIALALAAGLRLSGAPRQAVRWGLAAIGLIAVQGTIGYVQYFGGMPAGLVWVHVCGAVLIWITVLRLMFALRERGPLSAAEPPADAKSPAESPAGAAG